MGEIVLIVEFFVYAFACFFSWGLLLSFLSYRVFGSSALTATKWFGIGFLFSAGGAIHYFRQIPTLPKSVWNEAEQFAANSHQVFSFGPLIVTIFLWGYLRIRPGREDETDSESPSKT